MKKEKKRPLKRRTMSLSKMLSRIQVVVVVQARKRMIASLKMKKMMAKIFSSNPIKIAVYKCNNHQIISRNYNKII